MKSVPYSVYLSNIYFTSYLKPLRCWTYNASFDWLVFGNV